MIDIKNAARVSIAIILAALLFLAMSFAYRSGQKSGEHNTESTLVAALSDSLTVYKKKDSTSIATIRAIALESAKDFMSLQLKDKELVELQAVVAEYKKQLQAGSSVTKALIQTVSTLSARPTTYIRGGDTLLVDSIVKVFPEYRDTISNKWITMTNVMNKDTAIHTIDVKNDFTVVVGYKKKKPFVDLITDNPYTTTKQLRTFQVQVPKPKRWGIGISAGGTLNSNLKPSPYIGIGINYNIIRL